MKQEYRNAVKTRKGIRKAFSELLAEKRRMESITVGELAERADIARSTFYNHYTDIYAVAEELENELIQELSIVIREAKIAEGNIETDLRTILAFLNSNQNLYRQLIAAPDSRFFVEKLKNIVARALFEKGYTLPFSENEELRYIQIRFLTNACIETVCDCLKGYMNVSLDEVGETVISLLNVYIQQE